MNRKERIDYIKDVFPGLYEDLSKDVSHLLEDPSAATEEEIAMYNEKIDNYLTRRAINKSIVLALSF